MNELQTVEPTPLWKRLGFWGLLAAGVAAVAGILYTRKPRANPVGGRLRDVPRVAAMAAAMDGRRALQRSDYDRFETALGRRASSEETTWLQRRFAQDLAAMRG